ncbi:MAG: transglutaminase family protein [Ramlibacter sp.]|nr:transglutaminase family protein [Ramlibacter sp.]
MSRSTVEVVLEYEVLAPSHFCFNIEAAQRPGQTLLSERLAVSSGVSVHGFRDALEGNRFIRFEAPVGPLMVNYQASLVLEAPPVPDDLPQVPVHQIPDDVLRYLLPTRFCESDVLSTVAQQLFGHLPPGMARVRAVEQWLRQSLTYLPGSTGPMTTARDVFLQRTGVCRDFAHLGITLCRALNVPARLVVGYAWFAEPPQDFHAMFEAWLGGRWVLFDPTGMAEPGRLVRIGTGSDAKDVAFSTIYGAVRMTRMEIFVDEGDRDTQLRVQAELLAEDA